MIRDIACLDCKHFQRMGHCAAFPDGIPEKYLGGNLHHTPDGREVDGLIWEPRDPNQDTSKREARIALEEDQADARWRAQMVEMKRVQDGYQRKIRFWHVASGGDQGVWTRDRSGEITAEGAMAQSALDTTLARIGADAAWAQYAAWSNGYYASEEVTDGQDVPLDSDDTPAAASMPPSPPSPSWGP